MQRGGSQQSRALLLQILSRCTVRAVKAMRDGSTSEAQTRLSRHEVWRLQYRQRPYLKGASDDALAQRLKDIMNNLSTLTPEGKIGLLPIGPDGIRWMTLFTHVHEEYVSRGSIPPSLAGMPFPKPTALNLPESVLALRKVEIPNPGQALIKLGKRAHMQELYEAGRIRIAPARSYSDPSLNHAMGDDELKLDQFSPGAEITITFLDKQTGEPKVTKPIGDVTNTTTLATNYYVYCMTRSLEYRLFDDFESDACVIVRNPEIFSSRLISVMKEKLQDWLDWSQPVRYIDPYLDPKRDLDLVFSKHFRFWYQQEYRFAWIPNKGARNCLEPIFVELGSLEQISDLIFLGTEG